MKKPFHDLLLAEIRLLIPEEVNMVAVLMQLLGASKPNIYKKLKGKVAFSAEEILIVAQHFGISLDRFAHAGNGDYHKVSIDYSIAQQQAGTPASIVPKIEPHGNFSGQLVERKPDRAVNTRFLPKLNRIAVLTDIYLVIGAWIRGALGVQLFKKQRAEQKARQ